VANDGYAWHTNWSGQPACREDLPWRTKRPPRDGVLATFDGPARAVRCAQAIGMSLREVGLEIKAGCHTGEVELDGDTVQGIAVHIGGAGRCAGERR
jgi:hypothetical protein